MTPDATPDSGHPALSPQALHILISLSDQDLHGYSIIQTVAERTDGRITLSAGTLYGAIKRMLRAGLIEESDERPDPALDNARRRYYRITRRGLEAARREARLIADLADAARKKGLLAPEPRR